MAIDGNLSAGEAVAWPAKQDNGTNDASAEFARAVSIMARLRSPDGCPWDREQTFDSIRRHTLEETYEVFDAIERRAWVDLKDELGDLLLQVLFYAQMAEEAGHFSIRDVAAGLNAKLIRRHPHVFGEESAATAEDVMVTWEAVKQQERSGKEAPSGLLDAVGRHLPAMLEADKLGARAARVGFDWPAPTDLLRKLAEESDELRTELEAPAHDRDRIEDELGDLLFTAVQLARHLRLEPEFALRRANGKFRRRFGAMEAQAGGADALSSSTPEQLEAQWQQAKQLEPA